MKTLIYISILIAFFSSCKESKKNIIVKDVIEISPKTKPTSIELPVCNGKKERFKQFEQLDGKKINIKHELSSLFYAITKKDFYQLFKAESIKCAVLGNSNNYTFSDIYYKDNLSAKEVFLALRHLELNNENLNKYHDFYKRGLAFVLNSDENKITLISFNVFSNSGLLKKVNRYFKQHETQYEKVFVVTGISSITDLIE